jgi:hypothetical protein
MTTADGGTRRGRATTDAPEPTTTDEAMQNVGGAGTEGSVSETTVTVRRGAEGFGSTELEQEAIAQSARSVEPTKGQPSEEALLEEPVGEGGSARENQG